MWKGAEFLHLYCRSGLNNSVYSTIYFYPKLREAVSLSENLVTMKCINILLCAILSLTFATYARVLLLRFWMSADHKHLEKSREYATKISLVSINQSCEENWIHFFVIILCNASGNDRNPRQISLLVLSEFKWIN